MNIFRSKTLNKILPFLTARCIILCARRLQPPRDDCAVRVQWFSSVGTKSHTREITTMGTSDVFVRVSSLDNLERMRI